MLKGVSCTKSSSRLSGRGELSNIKLSQRALGPTEEAKAMQELVQAKRVQIAIFRASTKLYITAQFHTQNPQMITCFSTTPSFLKKSEKKVKRGRKHTSVNI